jgi:coenzyme F420-reducing hydrogenase gamma subunit
MGKPTVGIFGLTGCAGDQLAILNCEDELLDLVAFVDIRDFLMGSSGNDTGCALDVALVEGAVLTERDAETLRAIRKRSGLVACKCRMISG